MTLLKLIINIRKFFAVTANPNTYFHIRNWPVFLADFLGIIKNNYSCWLTNGLIFNIRANCIDKDIILENIVNDVYELRKLYPPPKTIIDLGAHIGTFSISAAYLFPQARIMAFEPDPESNRILFTNIAQNCLQKRVFPQKSAVASINGRKRLYLHGTGGTTLQVPAPHFINVNTVTLKSVFNSRHLEKVDLLKIDIEGGEYDVLYNLPDSIFNIIKRIHLEYHDINIHPGENHADLKSFLEKKAFSVNVTAGMDKNIGLIFAER